MTDDKIMKHDIDLIGYLEGSLSQKEKGHIKSHLKACPECEQELELLRKSEQLFRTIFRHRPEFSCPDTDKLVKFITGELPEEEEEEIERHVKVCTPCREEVNSLREAADVEIKMPEQDQWKPLPSDLQERIASAEKPLRDRLIQALLALKIKGESEISELLHDVDDLADRLMASRKDLSPSYALEREATLPSQTELKLRDLQRASDIRIELENYILEIKQEVTGTRIKVTREGKPVAGLKIRAVKETGKEIVENTDEKGEVLI